MVLTEVADVGGLEVAVVVVVVVMVDDAVAVLIPLREAIIDRLFFFLSSSSSCCCTCCFSLRDPVPAPAPEAAVVTADLRALASLVSISSAVRALIFSRLSLRNRIRNAVLSSNTSGPSLSRGT